MAASRYGTRAIEEGLYTRITSQFDFNRIPGLTEAPLVLIERPAPGDIEPYVYINVTDSDEIDISKANSARRYFINIQVVARSQHNQSAEIIRDAIVDEIISIIDVDTEDYIDLANLGYSVYLQNVKGVTPLQTEERGATYWFGNIDTEIDAEFVGLPVDVPPIQPSIFTPSGFEFTPTGNGFEEFDTGTLTGATTYPSGNNGWDFVSASYSLMAGSDGAISDNVVDIRLDDDTVTIVTMLSYQFGDDTSITTSVTNTDTFTRIRSLRYGATTFETITLNEVRDFNNWQGTNQVFNFGTVNPVGQQVSFTGNAGERFYIIYDGSHSITRLTDGLGFNHISAFTETTVGDYKVLLQTNPLVFDTSQAITYTIS